MFKRSLKILQVNTEKTWRGGERQTLLTMKGLLGSGIKARLLCLANHPLAVMAEQEKMPTALVRDQKQALRYLVKHGASFDLIHAQTSRAQGLAVMARPFHRRKVLYTRRVDFRPRGAVSRLKYRFTDGLVAISPAIKDILQTFLPSNNIDVIPSCIDTSREALPASAKALELKEKYPAHKIMGTIAAMVPHKDPLTMVRAVHELKKTWPEKIVFLHFGRGELESRVRPMVHELGLEHEYLLMGFDREVERYLPVMDVFVMSSQEEGLGSSVLEAFRYRIPVVSTTAGGLEKLVSGRGLVCPVHDYSCLAEKIRYVLDCPDRFRQMISDAHDYVLDRHSLESMTRDYIRVYEGMLGIR